MTAWVDGPRADAQVTVIDTIDLATSEGVLADFLDEVVTIPEGAPQEVRDFYDGGYDFEALSADAQEYIEGIDPGWGAEASANADEAQV